MPPKEPPADDAAVQSGQRAVPPDAEETASYPLKDPPPAWHDTRPITHVEPVRPRPRTGQLPSHRSDVWALVGCNALVFASSVCIMVLELTASRLVAKHVGQSLYTWTSVIGVVLAGITIGNYIGGWMADRYEKKTMLGRLFLISSALCFSVLWLEPMMGGVERGSLNWPMWVLSIVAGVFLLPAIALGTVSPIVASLALSRSLRTGITVGNVYAWGALGSIVGTFLTGFYLIDAFGTRTIVGITAAALAVMGVAVATGARAFRAAVLCGWLQVVAVVSLLAVARSEPLAELAYGAAQVLPGRSEEAGIDRAQRWSERASEAGLHMHRLGLTLGLRDDPEDEYHDDSNYSYINVGTSEQDGDLVRYLRLDKLIHSFYNPERPTKLYYEYEQIYAEITERSASRPNAESRGVSTLFLGGGGYVFPRWIEANFPKNPRIDVAELDPAVKTAVQREMGLLPDDQTAVTTHVGDARIVVDDFLRRNEHAVSTQSPVLYDFIYGDAFNDFSVPWHLTTLEFTQKLRNLLNPSGVYMANIIEIYPRTSQTVTRPVFRSALPVELQNGLDDIDEEIWQSCPPPFEFVELRRESNPPDPSREEEERYWISVRGFVTPGMKERLLGLTSEDGTFAAAVDELCDASLESRSGRFLGSFVNTIAQVFDNVYVFGTNLRPEPYSGRDTYVIVCSLRPLDLADLEDSGQHWRQRPFAWREQADEAGEMVNRGQMEAVLALARGLVLTDDYAPVDNLLVPVFSGRD